MLIWHKSARILYRTFSLRGPSISLSFTRCGYCHGWACRDCVLSAAFSHQACKPTSLALSAENEKMRLICNYHQTFTHLRFFVSRKWATSHKNRHVDLCRYHTIIVARKAGEMMRLIAFVCLCVCVFVCLWSIKLLIYKEGLVAPTYKKNTWLGSC